MKKINFFRLHPLFLLLLFASLSTSKAYGAAKIEEVQLDNGLKVLLMEEHKAPVVTFQVWYKVGSRNEITGKTGLSHLTEHMMFKGTTKHGKGEFSRIVAKNGGTENAFTANDYTAYFENFSADRIDLSLELESDRMQNLLIDPKEFQLERDVVKEERRSRTDDDPYSFLIENLYAVAFLVHTYHSPVIGWMSDLDHLVRDDVYNHYKQHYIPNNATVVVVGDFDTKVLVPKIKNAFGKIPKGPAPPQYVPPEPGQTGERRAVIKREAQLPFVFAGYHTPNYQSPDNFALTVLATLLSSGKSSRLYRSLIYDQQIALDAGGHYNGLTTDPELFYVYATARPGKSPEEIERALQAEISRIQTEPVSERELEKAKNQIEAEFLMGADSNFFLAMQIGTAESVGAGHPYVTHFIENIRKVTAADVTRVAKKYLVDDVKSLGTLIPLPQQPPAPGAMMEPSGPTGQKEMQ
ncbi:MAG TPA: pitrilysin family protein [Candidatus Manganitrophaceae bacterium]|nr:pitrilysin family protein [Candidatus Manganitrophaceae bacterium]